jgi:hypothetical protein
VRGLPPQAFPLTKTRTIPLVHVHGMDAGAGYAVQRAAYRPQTMNSVATHSQCTLIAYLKQVKRTDSCCRTSNRSQASAQASAHKSIFKGQCHPKAYPSDINLTVKAPPNQCHIRSPELVPCHTSSAFTANVVHSCADTSMHSFGCRVQAYAPRGSTCSCGGDCIERSLACSLSVCYDCPSFPVTFRCWLESMMIPKTALAL